MSRSTQPERRSRSTFLLLFGATLVAIVILGIAASSTRPGPAAQPTASHFVDVPREGATSVLRTVVVAQQGETLPFTSGTDGILIASLESGQIPAGATGAIVRSDANCQPDQDGVSHCLNELDFGADTVVVRHHHKMSEVPCLTPGEKVNVLTLKQYQG
jgi:hypothetical protein